MTNIQILYKYTNNEIIIKKGPVIILAISILLFLSFGLYHLGKFETVDEHFWKFDRMPQYWQALNDHNWKKTYINDKPGITVALISGIGLLAEPHPEDLRIRDSQITEDDLYTVYDSAKTERVNFSLRFPILLFNALFLIYFFWIIRKITDSDWIAAFSIAFIGISPILIGISQILNPDSLLWIFAGAAIFSYFALLKTNEKKFILLVALFTGLSLLSKYSANILFPFYLFILFSEYFINFEKYKNESRKYFIRNFLYLAIIVAGSVIIFSIFMPAVFIKAKYLYRGTIGAPGFSAIVFPLLIFILFVLADSLLIKNYIFRKIGAVLSKHQQKIFKIASGLMLLIFILVILNTLTGQKLVPFDSLSYDIYKSNGENFKAILVNNNILLKTSKELLLQFYPFVFSQLPILLLIILIFWTKTIFKGLNNFKNLIFFLSIIPAIYFFALIFSNVQANIRYSILLYPLFALLAGIALYGFANNIKNYPRGKIIAGAYAAIMIPALFSLWNIKPFYFNYSNFLLPQKFLITDSWGYGEYEAAQYLNGLPESQNLKIWTDRSGICQFIKGKCIRDYKINLEETKPDYFVFTKRGIIRHQFVWENTKIANKKSSYYYEKGPVWSIFINNKPGEFVKIVKSEE